MKDYDRIYLYQQSAVISDLLRQQRQIIEAIEMRMEELEFYFEEIDQPDAVPSEWRGASYYDFPSDNECPCGCGGTAPDYRMD